MQDIVESLFEIVFLKNSILSVSVFALIYFTLDAFHDRMYEKERESVFKDTIKRKIRNNTQQG